MRTQLLLSLCSLPVLIAWGLPLSHMTLMGNLISSPFLIIFLLLSSFIFFCEIFGIPSSWFIFVFEKLCNLWRAFLHQGSSSWLYAIDMHGFWIALFCLFCALIIFHHKVWNNPKKCWPLLALLLYVPFGFQKIKLYFPAYATITCINKTIDIERYKGQLFLFDRGALGEKKSCENWILYTFLPELIKKYGVIKCNTITLFDPTTRTLQGLCCLCQHITINKILIISVTKKSKDYKNKLALLQQLTTKKNITLLQMR